MQLQTKGKMLDSWKLLRGQHYLDWTKQLYIGMTSNKFKVRWKNHAKSFWDEKQSNETELSKYVWDLKKNQLDFSLKWLILKHAAAYQRGARRYVTFAWRRNFASWKQISLGTRLRCTLSTAWAYCIYLFKDRRSRRLYSLISVELNSHGVSILEFS